MAAGLAGCVFVRVFWVMSLLSLFFFGFLLSALSVWTLEAILVVGAMAEVPTQHSDICSTWFCDCCPSVKKIMVSEESKTF